MIRFGCGCLTPFAALFATTVVWTGRQYPLAAEECFSFGLALLAWPLLSASATAALVNVRRPRLVFDRRAGRRLQPFALGVLTGLLGIVLAALLIIWVDDYAPDGLIFAASSALAALAVVAPLRAARPGLCIACGYDLRASIDFGRCPECGLQLVG